MTITGISCTRLYTFVYYHKGKTIQMEKQPNKGSANQQPVDNFSENNCLNIVAVFTELSNFTP